MRDLRKFIPAACFFISLIFFVSAVFLPWWTVRTSRAEQIRTGELIVVDYMLLQTVIANEAGSNTPVIIAFNDWPEGGTAKTELASLFNWTLIVLAAAVGFAALALVLTLVSILKKPFYGYARNFAILGGLLGLAAPLILAVQAPGTLAKFVSVVPPQIAMFSGNGITGYWGASGHWVWGAGAGWFLLFVASLLLFCSVVLVQATTKRPKAPV